MSDSESSECDWEEVTDEKPEVPDESLHSFPIEGINITIPKDIIAGRKGRKELDPAAIIRRNLNREKRELQADLHKVSLLCLLAQGLGYNEVLQNTDLLFLAASPLQSSGASLPKHVDLMYIERLLKWFRARFPVVGDLEIPYDDHPYLICVETLTTNLTFMLRQFKVPQNNYLAFILVLVLRSLGMNARLIWSLQPLPLKPKSEDILTVNRQGKKASNETKSKKSSIQSQSSFEASQGSAGPKTVLNEEKSGQTFKGKIPAKADNAKKKDQGRGLSDKNVLKEEIVVTSDSDDEPSSISVNTKRARSTRSAPRPAKTLKGGSDTSASNPKQKLIAGKSSQDESAGSQGSSAKTTNANRKRILAVKKDTSVALRSSPRNKKPAQGQKPSEPIEVVSSPKGDLSDLISKGQNTKPANANKKGVSAVKIESPSKPDGRSSSRVNKPVQDLKPSGPIELVEVASSSSSSDLASLSESDSDFESKDKIGWRRGKKTTNQLTKKRKITPEDSKVVKPSPSSKCEPERVVPISLKAKRKLDFWVEVYLEEEEIWISVDPANTELYCDASFESKLSHAPTYILAFGNSGEVKDVTRRYASLWLSFTQKSRVDSYWWRDAIRPFRGVVRARDREEDERLDQQLLSLPLPKFINDYKNHPLFVLRRHLLKFEAIYPPEPVPVGFIKNEPVFERSCVKTLHSREVWLKVAKTVRIGESPYKVVKARPKYVRMTGEFIKDLPLELYGEWQVEDFIPPIAKDGIVPRNGFGNVELFQEKMLPKGTVHLDLPGLLRVAKKLGIDCARAVVGFEFNRGGSHPIFQGFVVCEEFKEIILDAWNQEQDEIAKKDEEKRLARIYGNWKKLIRGVLIREKVEQKYGLSLERKTK